MTNVKLSTVASKKSIHMDVMRLNISKTVVIPLFHADLSTLKTTVASQCPGWGGLQFKYAAPYLGFYLGPERGEKAWEEPLRKASSRAVGWGQSSSGLFHAAVAYKVHVLSTLTFIAQLERLPSGWADVEEGMLRAMVRGPGQWCVPRDLHLLRIGYGCTMEFPDLAPTAVASKMRVVQWEMVLDGGLQIHHRAYRGRRGRDSLGRTSVGLAIVVRAFFL